MTRRDQARRLGLALTVLVLAAGLLVQILQAPEAAGGRLRVRILDVGQGDATLVDTPDGQHLLVDGGPDEAILGLLGRFLAPPRQLALVVASHNHADHIGGLPDVLDRFPASEVWLSGAIHTTATFEAWLRAIERAQPRVKVVTAGHEATFGDVGLRVLHPVEDLTGQRLEQAHDGTIVLRLSYGATSFLLTGDLELAQERALLERNRAALGATVLKVSHHGSGGSSSRQFLAAVHPQVAVISVGAGNRFGHPAPETLERLGELGIPIYRTDGDGTVTCLSDGVEATCASER